jgi:hypothetical protein
VDEGVKIFLFQEIIEHKTAITLEQVKGELDKMREEVIEVDSRRAEIESKHDALIDPEES